MKKLFALTAAIMLLCMVGGSAFAGWTVINLHPAGATESYVSGVSGGQQVGYARIGGNDHAGLWSGTAESWVDLHPAGAADSGARGVSGGQQVGFADSHAGLWSGTAESWVDLNPAGAADSDASGVSGGRQVGYAIFGSTWNPHAALWNGTAASWVDLHPAGAADSAAFGVSGGWQVGYANFGIGRHAGLWSGTAESWVDLHPAGAEQSKAIGVSGGQQVGYARIGGNDHAGLWNGTAASWVDLNPAGAGNSDASDVSGDQQVGCADFGGGWHACLWSGTAESWVDLHAFLPAGVYSESAAWSVYVSADEICVAGYARNTSLNRNEAMLWHFTPDGPTIPAAKLLANDLPVTLTAKTVTYATPDFFYIEEDSRCTGIRVEKVGHGLAVGMKADVAGAMKTNLSRERYVLASSAVQTAPPNGNGVVRPVGMNNNSLGGRDWFVSGTGGQLGTTGSDALNNIGLLVKTCGRFQMIDPTTFTLDDGSGVPVKCTVHAGTVGNAEWEHVVVTGVSSIYEFDSATYPPNLLVRDIRVLQPVEGVSIPGTPSGNTSPVIDVTYEYSTSGSTCSQGHPVEYSFDWGDGTSSPWSASTGASHSWSGLGTEYVTVTARCQVDTSVSAASIWLGVTVIDSVYTGEMVYVPEGSFLMGNSGVGNDLYYDQQYPLYEEKPQHSVYLSGYWIGKYEVTRGEYRQFMNAGGYSHQAYWSSAGWSWKVSYGRTEPYYWAATQTWGGQTFTQTDNHPVVGVSYYEAEAFCNWAGGHLATEAQWEKAARWTGAHPNVYPWGDTWDAEKCNNSYDSLYPGYQTAPVGSYPSGVSPYGCHDMAGNVWEWVQDWYKSYPGCSSPFDYTGSFRVLRGGDWVHSGPGDSYYRCACRGIFYPSGYWDDGVGFRIAR